MKKLLLFCIGISLLHSCKKKEELKDNHTINGIRDISFRNQLSDTMSFSVDLIPGGVQETVALQIDGLPEDLSATFSTASGMPSFNSVLTINRQESSAGTYYLHIIGISAGGKRKAYPVKVVLPPLRDIRFDGKYYTVTAAINDSASGAVLISSEQEIRLNLYLPAGLPRKAGAYAYRVTAALPDPGEVQLILRAGGRYFIPGYNGTHKLSLDLDSTGAITKMYLPDIEVSTEGEPVFYRTLGMNYSK